MSKRFPALPLVALALVLPVAAQAQDYADLPPLAPMSEAEVSALPADMRSAPASVQTNETVTSADGVETVTRTRRIVTTRPAPVASGPYAGGYFPQQGYAPPVYTPVVFERQQWIDECRRRTAGRDKDETGLIIGGLLGAIAGGVAGYEIAGAGDHVLGTVLGVGGGGLIGGLLGSLFDGDEDEDRYDCEAALDAYLSQHGTPAPRIANREIAYPALGYAYGYPTSYAYAPPQQTVLVPVRSEIPQQVVVRETVREETYSVPAAAREIPAPRPSGKMIKGQ